MNDQLIEIDPKKLSAPKFNLFFSLGIVRNDISDLIYLQSLHVKEKVNLGIEENRKEVSPLRGRMGGRDIYIFRLIISHFYSAMELLDKEKDKFETDKTFINILDSLSMQDKALWKKFNAISFSMFRKEFAGVDRNTAKILQLCSSSRNDVTFHYYKTLYFINQAFNDAFSKEGEIAYATEVGSVDLNRSYYIDLATMKYLEEKSDLKLNVAEGLVINLLADFNYIISTILSKYHKALK